MATTAMMRIISKATQPPAAMAAISLAVPVAIAFTTVEAVFATAEPADFAAFAAACALFFAACAEVLAAFCAAFSACFAVLIAILELCSAVFTVRWPALAVCFPADLADCRIVLPDSSIVLMDFLLAFSTCFCACVG